jgi:hypothetical protein
MSGPTNRDDAIFAAIDALRALNTRIADDKKRFKQAIHKAGLNLTQIQRAVKALAAEDPEWFNRERGDLSELEELCGRYLGRTAPQQPRSTKQVDASQKSHSTGAPPPETPRASPVKSAPVDSAPGSELGQPEPGASIAPADRVEGAPRPAAPSSNAKSSSDTKQDRDDGLDIPHFLQRKAAATASASGPTRAR